MRNFTSSYFIMKSVCTEFWKGPQLHWFAAVINYSSALTGWSWWAKSFRHAKPEGHFPTLLHLELAALFTVLWRDLNLEVSGWSATHCGSGSLAHEAIMAEQILPVGWIVFWDINFSCLPLILLLPIQAGSRVGVSLPWWNCVARL